MYGLWYYNIPTLFEFNQFSSPFFHLVNARLLNAPGTLDLRSYETQSIMNDRVMELLGVRYLISDKLLPGRTPALDYQLVERRNLYVYPLGAANLTGYSVTHTRYATDAQEAINLMADPSLDLQTTAVLTGDAGDPPARGGQRQPLVCRARRLPDRSHDFRRLAAGVTARIQCMPPPRLGHDRDNTTSPPPRESRNGWAPIYWSR